MKRTLLLSMLSLSLGFTLMSIPDSRAALPPIVAGQKLPSLAPMLDQVLPTVVSVHVEGVQSNRRLRQAQRQFEGLGSGVIIDAQKGYVLTNHHVINNADKINVQLNDGREYSAKLLGQDEQSDIALLQLNNATGLTAIKMANSDNLRVGDFVIAIGNPFGLGQTATSGIISALGRSGLNIEGLENFIQTDASINRGNSGGALVNLNGELIGINTAILAPSGGNVGIGFAIPSNMAQSLSQQLIQFGEIRRSILGIRGQEMNADIAKAFKLNVQRGAFISEVMPTSAAAKAGIKAGDIVISLNGKTINSFAELRAKIGSATPGTIVNIGLIREQKNLTLPVKLEGDVSKLSDAQSLTPALQGAALSEGNFKGIKGIAVSNVAKESKAARTGLHKGDLIIGVNRQRVHDLKELRQILETKPPVVALNIIRAGENIYLLLR